jgi:hypothetical protein
MLQWWNPNSGELWPSIATLANSTGFTERGVQKILRRLEACGVVNTTIHSRGGRTRGGMGATNRFVLSLDRLPRREPVHDQPNPEPCSSEPRTAFLMNPEQHSPEPSIRNTPPEPPIAAAKLNEIFSSQGGMDGQTSAHSTVRASLFACGVRGQNLDILATSDGLTTELVAREYRDIRRDVRTRNIAAVLVARLAKHCGITLACAPPLKRSTLSVIEKIEQLRRLRR